LQQSKRFDEIDRKTQTILEALLESKRTRSQDIYDQNLAAAQLLSRTELVVTDQYDKACALIVNAIQLLSRAKEEHMNSSEKDKAEKIWKDEEELQTLVEENVLENLSFGTMVDREGDIGEAHKNTFAWLLNSASNSPQKQKWDDFVEWLKSGRGTYWINGKAGSGKSTLMRYITKSAQTRTALREWSCSSSLVIGSFFFWNSGTVEQRSQIGLLRTLLHEILRQHRDLIPIAMPSVWARAYSHAVQPTKRSRPQQLSLGVLMEALKALIEQSVKQLRLCLFIDGLDEYEGDSTDMADLFTDLVASDNIKVCLSSRPLVPLEYAFKSSPNIRLQDLTPNDIKLYVTDKMHGNRRFRQLATEQPEQAPALVREIVTKADGVFLWVVLVVQSLLIGVNNRDGMDDLERRLAELPTDLSALFENMLTKRIAPFYQARGAALFQIVRASRERNDQIERFRGMAPPLTLLSLSFADEKNPDWALNAPIRSLNESEKSIRCKSMEDRLKTCCAGLLEAQFTPNDSIVGSSGIAQPDAEVQYLHRTVKDYLHQPDVWISVTAKTDTSDFEPNISLLKSCILQLKASGSDEKKRTFHMSTCGHVTLALEVAHQAELTNKTGYIPLLDELDLVMKSLLRQTGAFHNRHWVTYYKKAAGPGQDWHDNWPALAVEYGLASYLDFKFRQPSESPREKKGRRPLLDIAISPDPRGQRYSWSPPTVAVLFAHGANPNASYIYPASHDYPACHSVTPWQNALAFASSLRSFKLKTNIRGNEKIRPDREEIVRLVCLFTHFIEHGADLTRSCNCGATTRDVLWIVEEVFHRWEPEESEALLEDLRRRMASAGMVSRFSRAWKKVRNYLTTDTTGCGIHDQHRRRWRGF
jgi:hypothetical protein